MTILIHLMSCINSPLIPTVIHLTIVADNTTNSNSKTCPFLCATKNNAQPNRPPN